MKIAKEEIISASESEQRISVGQLDTQNATANTAATIGTTNTLLSEMDKRHMHDRIRMSIATKDRTYQFIFNKKDRAAVQAILELAPKA